MPHGEPVSIEERNDEEVDIVITLPNAKKGMLLQTGRKYYWEITIPGYLFKMTLMDEDENVFPDEPFEIWVEGQKFREGNTDANGKIEVKVPEGSQRGKLVVLDMELPLTFNKDANAQTA